MSITNQTIEARNVNHPGVVTRVNKAKYEAVRRALLASVPRSRDGIVFRDLFYAVRSRLPEGEPPGGGSVEWYTTVVKLDLEARGLLARVPGVKPQRVRRVK